MKYTGKNEQIKMATRRLALWTLLWLMSLALATFGPLLLWEQNTSYSVLAIGINAVFGAGMIWANIRLLGVLDELQKKIQLEAMGIALGVGIVGGLSYAVMDVSNVIPGDAEIGFLMVLISVSYMVALLVGKRRFA